MDKEDFPEMFEEAEFRLCPKCFFVRVDFAKLVGSAYSQKNHKHIGMFMKRHKKRFGYACDCADFDFRVRECALLDFVCGNEQATVEDLFNVVVEMENSRFSPYWNFGVAILQRIDYGDL